MDHSALLRRLVHRRVLVGISIALVVMACAIALLPFNARGPRRDAVDQRFERWSCPPPVGAYLDIAGTPYWLLFDPEVPSCVYRAGNRLLLSFALAAVALSLLTAHVTARLCCRGP